MASRIELDSRRLEQGQRRFRRVLTTTSNNDKFETAWISAMFGRSARMSALCQEPTFLDNLFDGLSRLLSFEPKRARLFQPSDVVIEHGEVLGQLRVIRRLLHEPRDDAASPLKQIERA